MYLDWFEPNLHVFVGPLLFLLSDVINRLFFICVPAPSVSVLYSMLAVLSTFAVLKVLKGGNKRKGSESVCLDLLEWIKKGLLVRLLHVVLKKGRTGWGRPEWLISWNWETVLWDRLRSYPSDTERKEPFSNLSQYLYTHFLQDNFLLESTRLRPHRENLLLTLFS